MAITGSQKAYTYALSNVARSGATRSGYTSALAFISIGGVPIGPPIGPPETRVGVAYDSLTITDSLDEVPNTATFRVFNAVPALGQEVRITLGSKNNLSRIFAGHALTVDEGIGNKPSHVRADVSCVDYTWQLGFTKVTKRYTSEWAAVIATDLVTTFAGANGFTTVNVQPYLFLVDEITFTNEDLPDALTRLARRIGAYWYVDYNKDVHFFYEEPANAPRDLTPTHPTLAIDGFHSTADRTQALTRVYVEGRGSRLLSSVTLGESLLPLESVDMFTPGVFVKASFQGSDGGAQHLDFAGVVPGGGGTLVGPGALPAAAPVATVVAGTGVPTGSHDYAVTFTTAAGESLPSPPVPALVGAVPPAPVMSLPAPGGGSASYYGAWQVKITWFVNGTETLASPASNSFTNTPAYPNLHFTTPIGPAGMTTKRRIYFKEPGGPGTYRAWRAEFDIPNNTATEYDWGAQMNGPLINEPTGAYNQVNLSSIPIGNASVTGRKVYRTAANTTTPLKLLTTIANNTATTHTDTAADGSLGANAPTTDASGLQQPPGQVTAGSTSLVLAGTGAFQATGGWAIIGNGEQVIRYTGLTATALTGIPATGPGAITATIAYNSTITAAPMLTGIPTTGTRSILRALTAGDEIYLVVQVDDTARQAELAAAMGGAGIREEWVQDRRLSIPEARARGTATLNARPLSHGTLAYRCRDLRTASGKTITANFPAPLNVSGSFKIQSVTIDNFRPYPTQYPTFTVTASSSRFSFEDWLRKVRAKD